MPTTLIEQLLAGIHQTEKHLPRIKNEALRASLAAELDDYLARVRVATEADTPEFRALFGELLPLNRRIVEAGR